MLNPADFTDKNPDQLALPDDARGWRTCTKCHAHYPLALTSCPDCGAVRAIEVRVSIPGPHDEDAAIDLTIAAVQAASVERSNRWHNGSFHEWTILEWAGAMCGEAGEVANVCKKLRRLETGAAGTAWSERPLDREQLVEQLAGECADTFLYLVLVAARYGINLAAAVRTKYNTKSEEMGFPERL